MNVVNGVAIKLNVKIFVWKIRLNTKIVVVGVGATLIAPSGVLIDVLKRVIVVSGVVSRVSVAFAVVSLVFDRVMLVDG